MEYKWHIFLANLDPVIGFEQGKTRPVLVMSQETINQILPVVNVTPITTRKPGRKIYPNEILIPVGVGGQKKNLLCFAIKLGLWIKCA
jgi:mRNA interferase MazF